MCLQEDPTHLMQPELPKSRPRTRHELPSAGRAATVWDLGRALQAEGVARVGGLGMLGSWSRFEELSRGFKACAKVRLGRQAGLGTAAWGEHGGDSSGREPHSAAARSRAAGLPRTVAGPVQQGCARGAWQPELQSVTERTEATSLENLLQPPRPQPAGEPAPNEGVPVPGSTTLSPRGS